MKKTLPMTLTQLFLLFFYTLVILIAGYLIGFRTMHNVNAPYVEYLKQQIDQKTYDAEYYLRQLQNVDPSNCVLPENTLL